MKVLKGMLGWIREYVQYVPAGLRGWVLAGLYILVSEAVSNWILAPLLDIVPAYALFGLIFAFFNSLLWWRFWHSGPGPRIVKAGILVWLSTFATIFLYSETLKAKNDETYTTWALAEIFLICAFFIVVWLLSRGEAEVSSR